MSLDGGDEDPHIWGDHIGDHMEDRMEDRMGDRTGVEDEELWLNRE